MCIGIMHSLHLSITDMPQLLGTHPCALKTHNVLLAVLFRCQTLKNIKGRLQSITKVVIFIGSLIKVLLIQHRSMYECFETKVKQE